MFMSAHPLNFICMPQVLWTLHLKEASWFTSQVAVHIGSRLTLSDRDLNPKGIFQAFPLQKIHGGCIVFVAESIAKPWTNPFPFHHIPHLAVRLQLHLGGQPACHGEPSANRPHWSWRMFQVRAVSIGSNQTNPTTNYGWYIYIMCVPLLT